MIQAITYFITQAGWLAPLAYVASYIVTALLPVIPTPLVAAMGGTAFGFAPAVLYGVIGLGLGAFVALTLARRVGRPLLHRLVAPEAVQQWEALLGIRNLVVWGVIFFVLNLDIVVMASGLSTLSLRKLWLTAMIARLPWLLGAAWFGEAVLVSDTMMLLTLLLILPVMFLAGRYRPRIQAWLFRLAGANAAKAAGGEERDPAPGALPRERSELPGELPGRLGNITGGAASAAPPAYAERGGEPDPAD